MCVRPVEISDRLDWLRMRYSLWPRANPPHEMEVDLFFRGEVPEPEVVFVAEIDGQLRGFAEFSTRAYAEGCETGRVGYVEGWYVDPECRGKGVGRALVEAGEGWARDRGYKEFASDAELENHLSAKVHKRIGFEEAGQIRCFRKALT